MATDTALVVIGMQLGTFKDPEMAPYRGQELLERLSTLVSKARAASVQVIFVRQNIMHVLDPLYPGQENWNIHPTIAPLADELIIDKIESDSFLNTSLQQELDARSIKHLILTGVETEFSVDATCRQAFSRGYKVTVVLDGHSTWPNKHLSAEQIINHHNFVLRAGFASVVPSNELVFAES